MDNGEKITDPVFMETLLRRIQNQSPQISVNIPRKSGCYNTAILTINSEQGILIFDQLAPEEGHQHLLKTRIMNVEASFQGVSIRMQCHLKQVTDKDNARQYHMMFPSHLWYYQQRENFRVQISDDINFSIRFRHKNQDWLNAEVTDISPDGCGIKFNQDISFIKGELIKHCELVLPDKRKLPCKFIVRYSSHDDHQLMTHVGIKIIDLEPHDKKDYLRAIQNAQREMIRRQARLSKAG